MTGKGTISYTYDAAGSKLQKKVVDNTNGTTTTTLYLNGVIYQNDVLQFIAHEEGRLRINNTNNGYVYDYFLKDHLGNTRMTITDDYSIATHIIDATSYYPFGLSMKVIGKEAAGGLQNKFKYNGKEEQSKEFSDGSGLDYLDYGARMYDSRIGRFNSFDILANKYISWSPFTYCLNNPINFVDPDGKDVKPSAAFLRTSYGKVFQDLRKNNHAFGETIGKYENNKRFNLTLSVNDSKVKAVGSGAFTETPIDKSNVLSSANTSSYFLSSTTVPENSNYNFTEVGVLLIVAHESIHQKIGLTTKDNDASHNTYNTEREALVNILTEYSKENKLDLSNELITALSFSGQQDSVDFKKYISGLAKENGTSFKEEKNKFDKLVSGSIYQKK
jgi:RHS repeat-associated protein